MKALTDNNMATLIPPWATATPPYAYDALPTRCFLHVYEAIYHYDDAGSNRSITSSTSVTTLLSSASESVANEAFFPDPTGGHEWGPADLGVSFYGYRYYKPDIGRWVNRDPIGEEGGSKILIRNRNVSIRQVKEPEYTTLQNNPIVRVDPFGLTSYASNVRWRYAVIYRRDAWGWGAGSGNTRTANIGIGSTFPRRRAPCWRAYLFIVQARPINNPNLEPSTNASDPLRVFEFNNSLHGLRRYFPIVEFTMDGNSWQDSLWKADQNAAIGGQYAYVYRIEAEPAPILFPYLVVSIHLNRKNRVVVSGGQDENMGTSTFHMENETGPQFSQ